MLFLIDILSLISESIYIITITGLLGSISNSYY